MKNFSVYREGSRFARAMLIGLGSAKISSDISFVDGQTGRELTHAKVDLLWGTKGQIGASRGIEDLIEKAERQIAHGIAEKKGVGKKAETTSRPQGQRVGGVQ